MSNRILEIPIVKSEVGGPTRFIAEAGDGARPIGISQRLPEGPHLVVLDLPSARYEKKRFLLEAYRIGDSTPPDLTRRARLLGMTDNDRPRLVESATLSGSTTTLIADLRVWYLWTIFER